MYRLLGITANELNSMKAGGEEAAYEKQFQQSGPLFRTVLLKVRIKEEMVQDEARVKINVMNLEGINLCTYIENYYLNHA